MLKIFTASLIAMGLLMVICGIIYKPPRVTTGFQKLKKKDTKTISDVLESITSKNIISKILNYLAKDTNFFLNKFITRLIELSEAGLSLQQMYFVKFICFILCAILTIVIGYTNTINQTKNIVALSAEEKSVMYQDDAYDQSRYQLYKIILGGVGKDSLTSASNTEKYYLVEEKMAEHLNTSDEQIIREKTEWFLKTWTEVQKLSSFKYYYLLMTFIAAFLPELLLILRWLLRGCVYKKEIIKLEYIFELLARVDGVKTIDIINELEKSSKIYSKYLSKFSAMFKYNKQTAFDFLKSKNIKGLSKMANILEIYSLSDKELAIQILEREAMERDEQMIITAEESIDLIDLVAFLSIAPLVYELTRLMLDPMLDIVYKAFEFI